MTPYIQNNQSKKRWRCGSSDKSAYLASMKPYVQTSGQKKTKNKKKTQYCQNKKPKTIKPKNPPQRF
jgi:hypothetical protein